MTPTIVSHAKVQIVNRVTRMFRAHGFRVEHDNYGIKSYGDAPCEGVVHMIWGCPYSHEQAMLIGERPDIFWCENGWLTQQSGCYVDPKGTNERSSIVGAVTRDSRKNDRVWDYINKVHGWHQVEPQGTAFEGPQFAHHDYIFVPLQAECDTQVNYQTHIPAKYPYRQAWMLQRIIEAFPDRKIIVRPHPRWETIIDYINKYDDSILKTPNIRVEKSGNSYQWCSRAAAVIGINSTVLIEALTLRKPVASIGRGIFTGNKVTYELCDFADQLPKMLPHVESYLPDDDQLTRFFTLLMERQISYHDSSADDLMKYPVLRQMLEQAKGRVAYA